MDVVLLSGVVRHRKVSASNIIKNIERAQTETERLTKI